MAVSGTAAFRSGGKEADVVARELPTHTGRSTQYQALTCYGACGPKHPRKGCNSLIRTAGKPTEARCLPRRAERRCCRHCCWLGELFASAHSKRGVGCCPTPDFPARANVSREVTHEAARVLQHSRGPCHYGGQACCRFPIKRRLAGLRETWVSRSHPLSSPPPTR
jgi:hypothetical protein